MAENTGAAVAAPTAHVPTHMIYKTRLNCKVHVMRNIFGPFPFTKNSVQ